MINFLTKFNSCLVDSPSDFPYLGESFSIFVHSNCNAFVLLPPPSSYSLSSKNKKWVYSSDQWIEHPDMLISFKDYSFDQMVSFGQILPLGKVVSRHDFILDLDFIQNFQDCPLHYVVFRDNTLGLCFVAFENYQPKFFGEVYD